MRIALDAESAGKHGISDLSCELPTQVPTQSPAIVDADGLLWCLMHPGQTTKTLASGETCQGSQFELYAWAVMTRP